MPRPGGSTDRESTSAIRLLVAEAGLGIVFDSWLGPGYLAGLAGEAHSGTGFVAAFSAAYWFGTAGQLAVGLRGVPPQKFKLFTLALSGAARLVWLGPVLLGFTTIADTRSALTEPRWWLSVVVLAAWLSSLFSSAAAQTLTAWSGGLIPEAFHGRFFALRQRAVVGALLLANLVGAALLPLRPPGLLAGYGAVAALALAVGSCSWLLLSRVPSLRNRMPAVETVPREARVARNNGYARVVVFGALFTGAIQLSSPFMPYYFTSEVGVSMSTLALWNASTNIGAFAAAIWIGKWIDRRGPLPVLWAAVHGMAASPLLYAVISARLVPYLAPVEFFINGAAWCAYALGMSTLLLRVTDESRRARQLSIAAAAAGLAGGVTSVAGAKLLAALETHGGYQAFWLSAAFIRICIIWAVLRPFGARHARESHGSA